MVMTEGKEFNRRRVLRRLVRVGLALGLVVVGYGVGFVTQPRVQRWLYERAYARKEARFLNQPAPDIQALTIDGARWELSKQRGKVVILDFTATWCAPCVGAYPLLKSVYERHQPDGTVTILSVALDEESDQVRKHFVRHALPWPVVNEEGRTFDNSIARRYRVTGIPSIWIIDQEGRVVAMDAWGETIDATVDRLLGQIGSHD